MTRLICRIGSLDPHTDRSWSSLNCCRSALSSRNEAILVDRTLDCGLERNLTQPTRFVRLHDVVGGSELRRFERRWPRIPCPTTS